MTHYKYYRFVAAIVLSLLWSPAWAQKFPGLADTPPMGWNSWNKFGCDISENMIRASADAMVKSGLRDANGLIQADPVRFPSGINVGR